MYSAWLSARAPQSSIFSLYLILYPSLLDDKPLPPLTCAALLECLRRLLISTLPQLTLPSSLGIYFSNFAIAAVGA